MEYRYLGRSGLQVSAIGLGTNNFGGRLDAAASAVVINHALDMGINMIDTSNSYGGTYSEEYIGRALKGKRHQAVIATKVSSRMADGPNNAGNSRKHIMTEVENSLRRLNTDYIDLYQIHWQDANVPIEEDAARAGRSGAAGQSALYRLLQLYGVAGVRSGVDVALPGHRGVCQRAALWTGRLKPNSRRSAANTAWAFCRTSRLRTAF